MKQVRQGTLSVQTLPGLSIALDPDVSQDPSGMFCKEKGGKRKSALFLYGLE